MTKYPGATGSALYKTDEKYDGKCRNSALEQQNVQQNEK